MNSDLGIRNSDFGTVISDTWLLLALRWQIAWNSFRARKVYTQVFSVVGGIMLFGLFAALSAGAGVVAGLLLGRFPEAGLEPVIPSILLSAVALFLLIGSFGTALGTLFLSSDLDLLMTAPVDRKAVFVSKILNGMVWNYALVFALAVPALIMYGAALGYGPIYYVLALITVLGTPLLPAALGAMLVLLVARFAPARRVREVLGLMGALFGLACALLGQTSRFWFQAFEGTSNRDTERFLEGLRGVISLPLPPFLAGQGLEAAGRGDIAGALANLSVFLLLTFGVFLLCVYAADFMYATGWVRMQSSGSAKRSKQRAEKAAKERGWLSRVSADMAIAIKDWKVIPRDLRNFAQMLAPLIFWPIFYLNVTGTSGRRGPRIPGDFFSNMDGMFVAGGVLGSTVMLVSSIAFTSISREGKSWWLLKIAPVSSFELMRGKFLSAAIPYVVLSTMLMVVASIWRQLDPLWTIYGWLGVEVLGLGMIVVAVSLSVPWAKLDWDDPRKMTSGWGSFIAFAIWLGMGIISSLFLLLPVFFEAAYPVLTPVLAVVALLCATAISAGAAYLAYKYGASKLPEIG